MSWYAPSMATNLPALAAPERAEDSTLAGMRDLIRFYDRTGRLWNLPCVLMSVDHRIWAKVSDKLPSSYRVPDIKVWRAMVEEDIKPPPALPRRRQAHR